MSAQYEELTGPHAAAADTTVAAAPAARPEGPTPAGSWLKPKAELVELPDGNVALLRKPQLLVMMKTGQIPNPLMQAAVDSVTGAPSGDFAKTVELLDFIVAASFVSPSVSLELGEGELHIDELSDADKKFVVTWAQQGARAAERFRGDRPSDPGGRDGGDVRDPAE